MAQTHDVLGHFLHVAIDQRQQTQTGDQHERTFPRFEERDSPDSSCEAALLRFTRCEVARWFEFPNAQITAPRRRRRASCAPRRLGPEVG